MRRRPVPQRSRERASRALLVVAVAAVASSGCSREDDGYDEARRRAREALATTLARLPVGAPDADPALTPDRCGNDASYVGFVAYADPDPSLPIEAVVDRVSTRLTGWSRRTSPMGDWWRWQSGPDGEEGETVVYLSSTNPDDPPRFRVSYRTEPECEPLPKERTTTTTA